MAVLLQDNFDRADNATVVGSPQIDPAPVVQLGTMGISVNRLGPGTIPANVTWDLGTPNAELSFQNVGGGAGIPSVILGYVSATDFYMVTFQAGSPVQLIRVTVGGQQILYTSSIKLPVAGTSVCMAHHRDGIVRVYVDGVMVMRWLLEVPITSNLHGVRISSSATGKVDNLLGADAPAGPEPILAATRLEQSKTFIPAAPFAAPSFAYLGRDTKLQDIAEGA